VDSGLVDCGVEPGQRIWLTLSTADQLRGCHIPEGVIFSFSYNEDKVMDPVAHDAPPSVNDEAEVPDAAEDAPPSESTEQADGSPDLSQLQTLTGGNPALTVILALIVVVGGGAGWKFWNKLSEQKHEQRMREMELKAQKAGLGGAQPPPCQAKQAEVDAKLAETASRLAALEKKAASLSADFDGEDIERQVKKLQKVVKALQEQSNGG